MSGNEKSCSNRASPRLPQLLPVSPMKGCNLSSNRLAAGRSGAATGAATRASVVAVSGAPRLGGGSDGQGKGERERQGNQPITRTASSSCA